MGPRAVVTLTVILLWYASNVGVLLLNKFLLSSTGFRQPVFLTLCHMMACSTLAYGLSLVARSLPIKQLRSRRQLWKVGLLSTIFCVTIVLGNMSLKYIAVSFSQAVGSATPFFTALFALLLQGSRETRATYLTLVPIVVGVVLTSGGEPQFHAVGFAACMLATAGRALKSVVQAMLMSDPTEKLDPMSLLFYMSSFSVALLLPATAVLEPSAFARARALAAASPGFVWWLLFNSCMAYAVNLTNFMVTKYTSALTLQVLGNMKGVIAAVVSIALFRNQVTPRGVVGYAITVAGVFLYSESKRRSKAVKAIESAKSLDREAGERIGLVAKAGPAAGGEGGGVVHLIVTEDRTACAGGVLPTSTQQAIQQHRFGRSGGGSSSGGGAGSGAGGGGGGGPPIGPGSVAVAVS